MISRIEVLADALIAKTQFSDPESEEYQCRNPMALKQFTFRHEATESGVRKFSNLEAGYKAACFDLQLKCTGKSQAKVKAESPLRHLIRCYSMPDHCVDDVVNFLRRALNDETITSDTQLRYFVEGNGHG